ncbi:M20 family metallopeptidase [Lentzea sp. NEAU-D7]|uniref:M20 family metallopeptidase n=1 Tax=Lentzea sp. NEAU-D7 TaxID=2994667 RepID=UPI00224B7018|nr:M20 family metallopeptidase [Lentzea sp. NEAU-D7]MCX2951184.1 M20 family metallopeptidase [Lentzea sp. NEAU-D7]
MNLIDDIGRLVSCESPSTDLAAVARSAEVTAEVGAALLGAAPERIVLDGRTHLRWRLGSGPRRVLLLGHHDTVWPIGTLERIPFSVQDGVLRGPGCFDMKTGVAMIFHAVASLGSPDGVTVLVTGDEEVGSPSSRGLIETEAVEHAAVLVCEGSADGGALKTERKGTSMYEVTLHGRASHAGLEPERGVNATIEAAHQILAVSQLADPATGTTVVPTVLSSGTTTNTVPAQGKFMVDVRVRNLAEQLRVDEDMKALRPVLDGAKVEVAGGPNRPPMELSASSALFELASGFLPGITQAAVGGASDGNFTAGAGVPTLDGLGAVGGGAHAEHEHVLVSELVPRTRLLAALVRELT